VRPNKVHVASKPTIHLRPRRPYRLASEPNHSRHSKPSSVLILSHLAQNHSFRTLALAFNGTQCSASSRRHYDSKLHQVSRRHPALKQPLRPISRHPALKQPLRPISFNIRSYHAACNCFMPRPCPRLSTNSSLHGRATGRAASTSRRSRHGRARGGQRAVVRRCAQGAGIFGTCAGTGAWAMIEANE
jgi:hypothetical protein